MNLWHWVVAILCTTDLFALAVLYAQQRRRRRHERLVSVIEGRDLL